MGLHCLLTAQTLYLKTVGEDCFCCFITGEIHTAEGTSTTTPWLDPAGACRDYSKVAVR